MVKVSSVFFVVKTVDNLGISERTKCCNGEYLCLTSAEETASVCSWEKTNFCRERTDFEDSSSVNTLLVVHKPVSYNCLLKLIKSFIYLSLEFFLGVLLFKVCVYIFIYNEKSCITNSLVVCIHSILNLFFSIASDVGKKLFVNYHMLVFELRLTDFVLNLLNESTNLLDFFVCKHNSIIHLFFRNFVSACFNHNNLLKAACNSKVHFAYCSLLFCGVDNELAINKTNINSSNRTIERNV